MSRNGAASSHGHGGDVSADHVTIDRTAVGGTIRSAVADVDRTAVRRLHATEATFNNSAVGVASFTRGTIRQSKAGVVAARSVACDEVNTLILASPVVRGEVRTLIDLRSAIAIGVGIALGRALLSGAHALARKADPR